MALSSSTVFEVRPTVGSDSACSGGFVTGASGTDYSQQNAAQYSLTGLTTAAANAIILTASASVDMVGNLIQITGGTNFTAGFYQIVSVVAGVSITVDRNVTTAAGVAGTGVIGGALATVAQANSIAVASNLVYVKATGTYTVTTTLVPVLDSHGAPGVPYSIIGYTSTRGDNGQFTWTTSTNSTDLVRTSQSSSAVINMSFQNISFTTTAAVKADCINSNSATVNAVNVSLINCKINGFVIGIEGNFAVNTALLGLQLINSRVTGCSSHGVRNGIANTYVLGCVIDSNGGDGFNTGTALAISAGQTPTYVFQNSIFYNNGANGVNVAFTFASTATEGLVIISNCAFSTNVGAGLLMGSATNPLAQIINSIFDANGTYGFDSSSTSITQSALLFSNAFFSNTTAPTRGVNAGVGTVTLSASPYTSIGTDFSLNSTAGGGAACKGVGFPGVLNFGGTGHGDIGPLQSSGGSTTNVFVPSSNIFIFDTEVEG